MIDQFVPEEVCLKCSGCCRFSKEGTVWSPCLLHEEEEALREKIRLVPGAKEGEFWCASFDPLGNKCNIYSSRPFECQLYPFLINFRADKVFLAVDLNCSFAKERAGIPAFGEYVCRLADFLNSPKQIEILRNNPQLIQAYKEAQDLIELNI
jgi:Fe-S-cluster containining protein